MRLLMTALGSYGDVHPIIGLGAAMRARGHQATVLTNPHFQSLVESVGLEFLPIGTTQEYDELAHHQDLWHPFRGPTIVMRTCLQKALRPVYECLESLYRPGETLLVAHVLDMASRIFQEKHGAPMASVHLAPVGLRSFHESPQMFGMFMADWLPPWFRRGQYWLADKVIDRLMAPEINQLRQEQGLSPVSGILREWCFSPQLVLGFFPEWFAAPQPDWPANTHLTGFPLWDQSETMEMPDDVLQFLDEGESPVVFAPGSAMTEGEDFFEAAVEACQRLQRRGILLTKYPDQLPKNLPTDVRHFSFVPFSQLLPRAAALVHHGGIGTSAQALAAGVPQVVMPMAFDQLDNATRLKRLGVADLIRRKKFRGPRLARSLEKLLSSDATQASCRRWASRLESEDTTSKACEQIERIFLSSTHSQKLPNQVAKKNTRKHDSNMP